MSDKIITWQQLGKHIYHYDCWVLIEGYVYTVTDFMVEHPGGDSILVKFSGRDSTQMFQGVPHSEYAVSLRNARLVGKIESDNPPEGYLDQIADRKRISKKKGQKKLVIREDKISKQEVVLHKSEQSCWIIMNKKVYDVTSYLEDHPGGVAKIIGFAGQDATEAFDAQLHSKEAIQIASKYYIGELAQSKSYLGIILLLIVLAAAGAYFLLQ